MSRHEIRLLLEIEGLLSNYGAAPSDTTALMQPFRTGTSGPVPNPDDQTGSTGRAALQLQRATGEPPGCLFGWSPSCLHKNGEGACGDGGPPRPVVGGIWPSP